MPHPNDASALDIDPGEWPVSGCSGIQPELEALAGSAEHAALAIAHDNLAVTIHVNPVGARSGSALFGRWTGESARHAAQNAAIAGDNPEHALSIALNRFNGRLISSFAAFELIGLKARPIES